MLKKCLCNLLLFTLMATCGLFAQNTDQQLQTSGDSLKKAQQAYAVDSVPAAQPPQIKKDNRPMGQRIHFGVSTGFWINPGNTYFEFSPMLSYHFPKTFSVGAGPAYVYNRDRVSNISLHGWGGKIYGKANFTSWVYGYTEYQGINNQHITGFSNNKPVKSSWYVDSWFLSMGLNIPLGRKSINVQCLYDVLYKESRSYTYSPVTYRIGFGL